MKTIFFLLVLLLSGMLCAFKAERKPVIFMIGDSTMANKDLERLGPERGWGQMLPGYLSGDIVVDNHAKNGRSTRSFRKEGLWNKVISQVREGDYVFIQFGHNDEKEQNPTLYSDPRTDFRLHLKRYIQETREKGGIPVLFTSIARRHFRGDSLLDTHGEWILATRAVAQEEKVVLIDMNRSTSEWLRNLGEEVSRQYFMWVAPKTNPLLPKGKKDDTHLNVAGGRAVARLAVDEIKEKIPALAKYIRYYDFVVAKDGSGDFFSIQEAIDIIPMYRSKETIVYVRQGNYHERLLLSGGKNKVKLVGEDKERTVICNDEGPQKLNQLGEIAGVAGSVGFYIYGDDFTAENLTFVHTKEDVGSAIAVLTLGKRTVFQNCRFSGYGNISLPKGKNQQIKSRVIRRSLRAVESQ